MNTKVYRSANGRPIDFESIRLQNEDVIAVGNMRVNARGDELGRGGKVVRTREQIMKEYYALHSPTALDDLREQMAVPAPVAQPPIKNQQVPPLAPISSPPIQEPIVEGPITMAPTSGLDENDMLQPDEITTPEKTNVTLDQPVVTNISQSTMVQFQNQPAIGVPPQPTKEIPKGIPAPQVVPLEKPHSDMIPSAPPNAQQLRGSLAGAVAKNATVTQTEKLPMKKANGIQRF
jgi:hypothetical protein